MVSLGAKGAKLTIWRDTCAALGDGRAEELATSPHGGGTAGKVMGLWGITLRAGRGSGEERKGTNQRK